MKRGAALAIFVVVVVAAIGAGVYWYRRQPASAVAAGSAGSGSAGSAIATGSAAAGGTAGDPDEPDPVQDTRYRVIDSDARLALLNRIAAARAARASGKSGHAPSAPADPDDPAPLPGELTPDQIMQGLLPLLPLFKECYTQGLERRTIKNGKVEFHLRLTGEPEIGTVVDPVELRGDPAFLADAELAECLNETITSVELPPMKEGNELEVTTTMVFTEDEDEDGEGAGSGSGPAPR